MRQFLALVVKDLRLRFSSPSSLLFFIILPLVFTAALAGSGDSGEGKASKPLALVQDRAHTEASAGLLRMLKGNPIADIRETSDPAELIRDSEASLLIRLDPPESPGDFPLVQFKLSPWKAGGDVAKNLGSWLSELRATKSTTANSPPATSSAGASGPAYTSAEQSSAGQLITWTLVPLLGIGSIGIAERRRGTRRRILVAPLSSPCVSLATAVSELVAALAQIGLLVAFGALAFKLDWLRHPLELLALSLSFCLASVSLGTLLGLFCKTERQASSLALGLAMVLAILGGCWYPASLFPSFLREASHANPVAWAMEGYLSVLSPKAMSGSALANSALLGFFAAVIFLLAFCIRRIRPEKA